MKSWCFGFEFVEVWFLSAYGSGHTQRRWFLSALPPQAFFKKISISIRIDLRHFWIFAQFLSALASGIWQSFQGSSSIRFDQKSENMPCRVHLRHMRPKEFPRPDEQLTNGRSDEHWTLLNTDAILLIDYPAWLREELKAFSMLRLEMIVLQVIGFPKLRCYSSRMRGVVPRV